MTTSKVTYYPKKFLYKNVLAWQVRIQQWRDDIRRRHGRHLAAAAPVQRRRAQQQRRHAQHEAWALVQRQTQRPDPRKVVSRGPESLPHLCLFGQTGGRRRATRRPKAGLIFGLTFAYRCLDNVSRQFNAIHCFWLPNVLELLGRLFLLEIFS